MVEAESATLLVGSTSDDEDEAESESRVTESGGADRAPVAVVVVVVVVVLVDSVWCDDCDADGDEEVDFASCLATR